jgi:hypothetical protein
MFNAALLFTHLSFIGEKGDAVISVRPVDFAQDKLPRCYERWYLNRAWQECLIAAQCRLHN